MGWVEVVSIILNLILASGIVGYLLFYNSKKRQEESAAAKLEADVKATEIGVRQSEFILSKETIEFLQSQLSEAYIEIDKMQDIINKKRNEIIELIRIVKDLEVQLIEEQSKVRKLNTLTCCVKDCKDRVICNEILQ